MDEVAKTMAWYQSSKTRRWRMCVCLVLEAVVFVWDHHTTLAFISSLQSFIAHETSNKDEIRYYIQDTRLVNELIEQNDVVLMRIVGTTTTEELLVQKVISQAYPCPTSMTPSSRDQQLLH